MIQNNVHYAVFNKKIAKYFSYLFYLISDKRLANNTNVIIHVLHHTDERLHKCEICDQAFYDASSLQKHKNTHLFKKPFICNICGKDFAQKVNLKKHHMNRHQYMKPCCLFCNKF
jgi:uncharacterized Zn-finger protein